MNYGKIVTELSKYLNNWTWERLPLMTQSILLISYAHFYYVEEIAKAIVIDIALELAKKFIGDTKQIGFINGILDNALKNDKFRRAVSAEQQKDNKNDNNGGNFKKDILIFVISLLLLELF